MRSISLTITDSTRSKTPAKDNRLMAVHPGEVLREEFLEPLSLSVYRVAKEIGIPSQRLNDVVLERRGLTADTAIRLAKFFGTSDQFWMSLQAMYDLDVARDAIGPLEEIRPFHGASNAKPRQRVRAAATGATGIRQRQRRSAAVAKRK